ncbi:MAG: hypothetical protein R6W76_03295 [Caldilinea sp.]
MPNPSLQTATSPGRRRAWWQIFLYRVGQFFNGLFASIKDVDEAPAIAVLSPTELVLFRRMPVDARRHSLSVLRTLQQESPVSRDLAVAALLHDVGKVAADEAGAYLGLWLRGPIVLTESFAPQWLDRIADVQPSSSLRYALYVQMHHPGIGAQWAQQAGCSDSVCWLIAHHQAKSAGGDTAQLALLARLQAADEMN